jgi:hypothetical protein
VDSSRRVVTAGRLKDDERIRLDGVLDEEAWLRATPARDFVQQDPDNGQPATEPTEVRILFDRDVLYMGVKLFDKQPDDIVHYHRRRDEMITADDKFAWIFDTYLDGRSAYYFDMTPAGLMGDAVVANGGSIGSRDWHGIWDARAQINDAGWVLEIAIPFRTLNFKADSDWGVNFNRTLRRRNELSQWMGSRRNQNLLNPTHAGLLTGISSVSQGHGLDLKPYGLYNSQAAPGRGLAAEAGFTGGLDVGYNLTSSVKGNLTINTDFAQTEVDQRQVNLTRFSLFFPEKRDFFLDGSMFFDFASSTGGARDNSIVPFFSRRIGLSDEGLPQKIDAGGKVTGQIGREDLGVLHVRTGEEAGKPAEDFSVLRLKHNILQRFYVGTLYTRRAVVDGGDAAQTIGVDFLNSWIGARNVTLSGFYLATPQTGGRDQSAYGVLLEYPNDFIAGNVAYREIQRGYLPAVGFTLRNGVKRVSSAFSVNPRPRNHPYVRRFSFGVDTNTYFHDASNTLLNRDFDVTAFQADFHSQDSVQAHVLQSYERLDRAFPIGGGITLPAGSEYDYLRYRFVAATAQKRRTTLNSTIETGGFYDGTRQRVALDLTFRAGTGIVFSGSTEWNRIDLSQGSFSTSLYRLLGEVQFTPRVYVSNTVQFDSVSRVVGWQSRMRWIARPGNDLYVVFTGNWRDDPLLDRLTMIDRYAATKFVYTYRF